MQQWFKAKELVGLKGLSKYPSNITRQAKRENWITRPLVGVKGGGLEYFIGSLPEEIQTELRTRFAQSIVEAKPKAEPRKPLELTQLTDKQRATADSRMAIVQKILELEQLMKRSHAIDHLCALLKSGKAPLELQRLAECANAKKSATRTLSRRTLNAWLQSYLQAKTPSERLALLAPQQRQEQPVENYFWLGDFLAIYRQRHAFTLTESYRLFEQQWQTQFAEQLALQHRLPSLNQVRHALAKLPKHILMKGRLTGVRYKQLLGYVERDWNLFDANDIWIGDGHSLKMKVAHPVHGRPFTPELTMIVDGSSRKIVGWSLALSESGLAVLDALRHGIHTHGVPAIYYSDNGGGEKNKLLDDELCGVLPRFGISHATGIAGNAQGRGIIERLNKTVGLKIAERFATFYGKQADPEATRQMLKGLGSLAQRNKKRALTPLQQKAQAILPDWETLKNVIEAVINWYNTEHIHSRLQCTPAEKYERKTDPEKIFRLTEQELRDIARPQFKRKTERALVWWNNQSYYHLELLNHQGKEVLIGIDIHDAQFVQVRTLEGRFICHAELNGNKCAAFPESYVEQAQRKRFEAKTKRLESQNQMAKEEQNPIITIEHQPDFSLLRPKAKKAEAVILEAEWQTQDAKPIFRNATEKRLWEAEQAKK